MPRPAKCQSDKPEFEALWHRLNNLLETLILAVQLEDRDLVSQAIAQLQEFYSEALSKTALTR